MTESFLVISVLAFWILLLPLATLAMLPVKICDTILAIWRPNPLILQRKNASRPIRRAVESSPEASAQGSVASLRQKHTGR